MKHALGDWQQFPVRLNEPYYFQLHLILQLFRFFHPIYKIRTMLSILSINSRKIKRKQRGGKRDQIAMIKGVLLSRPQQMQLNKIVSDKSVCANGTYLYTLEAPSCREISLKCYFRFKQRQKENYVRTGKYFSVLPKVYNYNSIIQNILNLKRYVSFYE